MVSGPDVTGNQPLPSPFALSRVVPIRRLLIKISAAGWDVIDRRAFPGAACAGTAGETGGEIDGLVGSCDVGLGGAIVGATVMVVDSGLPGLRSRFTFRGSFFAGFTGATGDAGDAF